MSASVEAIHSRIEAPLYVESENRMQPGIVLRAIVRGRSPCAKYPSMLITLQLECNSFSSKSFCICVRELCRTNNLISQSSGLSFTHDRSIPQKVVQCIHSSFWLWAALWIELRNLLKRSSKPHKYYGNKWFYNSREETSPFAEAVDGLTCLKCIHGTYVDPWKWQTSFCRTSWTVLRGRSKAVGFLLHDLLREKKSNNCLLSCLHDPGFDAGKIHREHVLTCELCHASSRSTEHYALSQAPLLLNA